MAKAAFNMKKALFLSKLGFYLRNKQVNGYTWRIALCGTEIWILVQVHRKYLERFKM